MNEALLYNEQFAKVFPFDWEMSVLAKYIAFAKTLLDVGCGTGRHIIPLTEKGLKILGIDKNKAYVTAAKSKLKSKRQIANIDLIIADARFLPLKHALFDAVICMGNVLGDVDIPQKGRVAIIQEIIDSGKSEAVFIIELVHRYWRPTDMFVWFYRYLAASIKKLFGQSLEYGDYTETIQFNHRKVKLTFHAFTTREAKQLLASQGLQTRIEKRAKFFHDWFILVATH